MSDPAASPRQSPAALSDEEITALRGLAEIPKKTTFTARTVLRLLDALDAATARVESLEGRLMMIGVHTDQDHIRHLVGEMFTAATPTAAQGTTGPALDVWVANVDSGQVVARFADVQDAEAFLSLAAYADTCGTIEPPTTAAGAER